MQARGLRLASLAGSGPHEPMGGARLRLFFGGDARSTSARTHVGVGEGRDGLDGGHLSLYNEPMVSVTVNLDEDVMEKLAARAASEGTTVPVLIAQIVSSGDDGIALTAEQEQAIIEADAEVDRGEWVSAEEALAQLRARPR